MENLANLFHGFLLIFSWYNIGMMTIGLILGVIIGVLPGLGGPNGVAILLPLTFTMSPTSAIVMLSCIYWGPRSLKASTRWAKPTTAPSFSSVSD